MIRYIYLQIILLVSAFTFAQTNAQNYTTEIIYSEGRNPFGSSTPGLDDFVTTTYYDALGRPIQQVQKNASPVNNQNIVTHVEYEKNIGQTKEYLPFTTNGSNADYITNGQQATINYYNANYSRYGNSTIPNPYSEKKLEKTPSPRVLEVGAPGIDWNISFFEGLGVPVEDRNTIRYAYSFNGFNEVKKFSVNTVWDSGRELYTNSITENGYYEQNSLKKTVTKNENWKIADGKNNTTEEFTAVDGKIILKRTYNAGTAHDTFYVYDFYGNLAYVLPPLANGSVVGNNLEELCYQYLYDEKNRLVEKKLPQKSWEYVVYDTADRIVMTGPVNNPFTESSNKGWIFTKYDVFGRVVYTGYYEKEQPDSDVRKNFANTIKSESISYETKTDYDNSIDDTTVWYTNDLFPKEEVNLLTINYYDDYESPNVPESLFEIETGSAYNTSVKGLLTSSWVRVVNEDYGKDYIKSYTLYNDKYQPIRNYTTNFLGGYQQTDYELTFRGLPLKTITIHKKDSAANEISIANNYGYDNKERLITHTHSINGGAEETILENVYDELGSLTIKKVGGTTGNALQNVDYKYNIRGWLTDINNAEYYHVDTQNDLFEMMLNYNQSGGWLNNKELYNGNINSVYTRTKTDNIFRGYAYHYDDLNRITLAQNVFYQNGGWRIGVTPDDTYNEELTYDKNGNILTLNRTGESIGGQGIKIDDLTYTYSANQLQTVTDVTNSPEGFNDGNTTGTDYTYDAFGNLKTDKNKSITNITYNHLNLPVEITFATGKITYTYDATGTKVKKVVQPNSGVAQTTDYLYGFQYLNGQLQFFPHAEGYVKPTGTNSYLYVYQYKDHLGNVRLSYADCDGDGVINPATEILEENNYYPFGVKHKGYNQIANSCRSEEAEAYKFLNKEYEDSFALNVTETDFRHYDNALGRFNVLDPMAELAYDFTPYRYGFNNPVYFNDPSGLFESYFAARFYQLSHGLFGSTIGFDGADGDGHWYIDTGKSMITQVGEWILTTYELDGGGMGVDKTRAGGSTANSNDNSQSKKSDGGFWKFMEAGGMFNIWGRMKDDPGFKPNSRKRSAVAASMNYDQVISQSLDKYWWARVREILGGIDTRNGNIRSNLNITETKPKSDVSSSEESITTKAERQTITIEFKKYQPELPWDDTGRAKIHSTETKTIYKDEQPRYRQLEREDSIRNTEKRW